ncbi:hypothetical protein K458DRAFT_354521 [Lentithecium fluviatile CBS 122367]|uniref:EthD domain-containing protein n=1 Tax=Lentithecium fluviatile CBS 122367 TaxID=1168545 RepID=A0A6G1JNZ1_9PLEO|nr:hypothetical protein K458DRAFT_354521 [Lentithecium fluviatile CBS 122367]
MRSNLAFEATPYGTTRTYLTYNAVRAKCEITRATSVPHHSRTLVLNSSAMPSPPKQWSGPGIMQSYFKLKPGSKLSQETLEKWWQEEYLPKVVDTGIVKSAWTWNAVNPDYERQHMVIYKVPDLAPVQSDMLKKIPRTSDMFPTDGPVDDFIQFESRIFELVQLYETGKQPEDAATKIMYAAMQPLPGGEADLDAWYREEHNEQMSKEPGWKRTTRFKLLFQTRNDGKKPGGLDFLAIHEFGEGNQLGKDVHPLDPMTDWTKKAMAGCTAIDAAIYEKAGGFGKAAG